MRQASNLGEELDEGNRGDFYFVFLVHLVTPLSPRFFSGTFRQSTVPLSKVLFPSLVYGNRRVTGRMRGK
jgi:hypothetical protein